MQPLRYGIIGCGVIGPLHAHSICQLQAARLAAVCDIDRSRAEATASRYGSGWVTTDFREVLKSPEVDAVCICTPHYLHAEMAVAATAAGKHVLCEKPMAISAADMDRMIAAADRAGVQLGVCFQHRFDPRLVRLKALIDAGRFGRLLLGSAQLRCLRDRAYYRSAAWRGTWAQEGGGVLINQAIHTIDLMLWLFGNVESVTGALGTLCWGDCIEVEDTATASVTFAGGAQGMIAATSASHLGWQSRLEVYGTNGSAEINTGFPKDSATLQLAGEPAVFMDEAEAAPSVGKPCYGNSHALALDAFTDCVLAKRRFVPDGREGRRAVDLILSLYGAREGSRSRNQPDNCR